jgi:hypothetical protein
MSFAPIDRANAGRPGVAEMQRQAVNDAFGGGPAGAAERAAAEIVRFVEGRSQNRPIAVS